MAIQNRLKVMIDEPNTIAFFLEAHSPEGQPE